MPNYITVRQLSDRWNITPRRIQTMCQKGMLPGAVRFGKSWMIPQDAQRPADHRFRGATDATADEQERVCYSVMAAAYCTPGCAEETIRMLSADPDAMTLTKAQFAYLRGDTGTAAALAETLFDATERFEIKIGAAFLSGICALYRGNVAAWLNARLLLERLPCPDAARFVQKEMWLAVYGATIFDMSAYPDWFRRGCFDALPLGYYPAARVHYCKYLYIQGDARIRQQSISNRELNDRFFLLPAICEPLISQTAAEKAIISEIYLRLICASCYHHAGQDGEAVRHIDRALALALPDRLWAPFAEQRSVLDTLLDERLRAHDKEAFREVKRLNKQMSVGWSHLHNTILNRSKSMELTARELEAARLAVFGLTNDEISVRMGVSLNSVKSYLQTAMDKTGAKKRAELAAFI